MKKHLAMLVALLLVVALAVPAFAAVEFKYGGQMRVRYVSQNNIYDANDEANDNTNFVDQRLRLYFTFQASENLKVVWKVEMGDTTWGRGGGRLGAGGGGNVGADSVSIENKNIYMEFNIPNTLLTADVGIQTLTLLDSWIVDDDFSAAVLKANLDPFKVAAGYVAGQTSGATAGSLGGSAGTNAVTWKDRIDSWFVNADYKGGPFGGSLVGFYQNGHDTNASVDPTTMFTPFSGAMPNVSAPTAGITGGIPDAAAVEGNTFGYTKDQFGQASDFSFLRNQFGQSALFGTHADDFDHGYIKDNNLIDLGVNFNYKQSWMSAYVNFVKNLGSFDVVAMDGANAGAKKSVDYTGWMVDAGANLFCGPYTFNIGGFYTTGDKFVNDGVNADSAIPKNPDELNRFSYPLSTQKYFSEIMGGGILDNFENEAHTRANGLNGNAVQDFQWEAYGFPSNIWTATVGAAWQALEKTKISASYWYFGTSEDVVSGKLNPATGFNKMANDIGHEIDLYITQGIVDGLTLDLVGAYLITGDAYTSAVADPDNVYELGARLQWNF